MGVLMRKIWNPGVFQGRGKKKDYFEGWYFKSVSKDEKAAFAIIPGVSITRDPLKSHAFIMVMDARHQKLYYYDYPLKEFWASADKFEIRIGRNSFNSTEMILDLEDGNHRIQAQLKFENIISWPVKLFSPGVMGWYTFIPFMECYHGVLSFNHTINGYVDVNGERNDFTGGKGYMEKDWGSSMPSSWIWMQTNHFDEEDVSLFGSVAKIPWIKSYFTGYIFGLYHKGHLYHFTTYTGAKIDKLNVSEDEIEIIVRDKHHQLEISASRTEGVDLPAPSLGEMKSRVNESLKSRIHVKLLEINVKNENYKDKNEDRNGNKKGDKHVDNWNNKGNNNEGKNKVIFEGTGRNSGLEFVGNLDELLKGFKK